MKEKKIQIGDLSLQFAIEKETWRLTLPKSLTRAKDIEQLALIAQPSDLFVPVEVSEEQDLFDFTFRVKRDSKKWEDLLKLRRNDKLRFLCNIARFKSLLVSRTTFFLHPDNLVADDNLLPSVVYRGIRGVVPPFETDENAFFTQYKCLAIALFSKEYGFDELYNGSLPKANETAFEREVNKIEDLDGLIAFLEDNYKKEQVKTDKTMQWVPSRQHKLFKRLSYSMIAVAVILAVPLVYFLFIREPYQEKLLAADKEYLASDYGNVIATLEGVNPNKLPYTTKYILASSYINVENLSDKEKEAIMKNVSLKSDENYLLYWIYNGRGNFDDSIEKAKYIDDPTLIMYGLIKKIEEAKNDPKLSGNEREKQVKDLQDQLDKYRETYHVDNSSNDAEEVITGDSTSSEMNGANAGLGAQSGDQQNQTENKPAAADQNKAQDNQQGAKQEKKK
ncbi:type VII secretion protein EssB [Camelliibacillus cellulosilyticus]|uniref:Type VII secretion protein EssB n=1 Tax=Camelliibacillus cellulosilyticus TaxID=2174486 RepID=A0ABV9GUE5_9BACL